MKFGSREICNVVFRAKTAVTIGSKLFREGQPVLYIDSAKTSTLEGAATTVYAQGGRGNARLIAWEGEKTLTFTVEDALISPIGLSVLTGAGLISDENEKVHVHLTALAQVNAEDATIKLEDALNAGDVICETAPIFVMETEEDGSLTATTYEIESIDTAEKTLTLAENAKGKTVMVDFYVVRDGSDVKEIQIDAANFAGYYYVEAETLYRRQDNGLDMPAVITIPNVKIQSNFTFSMASSGDPSTFTFTMDAMPGYTYFDKTKKVLCVIQIVDAKESNVKWDSVMKHDDDEAIKTSIPTSIEKDKNTKIFNGTKEKIDDDSSKGVGDKTYAVQDSYGDVFASAGP